MHMDNPGQRLKQARERLNLHYRDGEDASLRTAEHRKNDEFATELSRWADIGNTGTVPSIYRFSEAEIDSTHLFGYQSYDHGEVQLPPRLDDGADFEKATSLSRMTQRWGRLPLLLLNRFHLRAYLCGYMGTGARSMYSRIRVDALVLLEETKRRVAINGWVSEFERPIYFFAYREGFASGWCHLAGNRLTLQPHPATACLPSTLRFPDNIDVIGQVVGVAMRFDSLRRIRNSG